MKLEGYSDGKRFTSIEYQDITTKQMTSLIGELISDGHSCTLISDGPSNNILQVRENSLSHANDLLCKLSLENVK